MVLSTAHACALTTFDTMRLDSNPRTPAETKDFLFLLLEVMTSIASTYVRESNSTSTLWLS